MSLGSVASSPNAVYGNSPVVFALSIFRSHEFLTITTVADTSVTGTASITPRLYWIIFNPSATATAYVNFGATASATAGIDLLPQSAFQIGLISNDARIFSTAGSVACKIMALS